MTIINLFIGILFMMYLGGNVPYREAYQNYRALVIQLNQLTILAVTMYYPSMKSNDSPEVVFSILSPAVA
jgi:hypothetical protein